MSNAYDELVEILNRACPDEIQGRERAEYVAAGVAMNAYLAVDYAKITAGFLEAIFRALWTEGYEFAKREAAR